MTIGSETIRFTNLNTSYGTTATTARAGYSNYQAYSPSLKNSSFPVLTRSQGFNLSFRLRINSETHNSNDRAGFSVTLLGSDKWGIELGFWTGEIRAQRDGSNLFTHESITSPTAESAFLSTQQWISSDLLVLGNRYYLSSNSSVILQGAAKNYQAYVPPAGLPYDPYEQANFLFLGDNTSQASSNTDLASVAISTADLKSTGNDTVTGSSTDDVINGGAGNDFLHGGGAADVLIGGAGNDTVNGGSGSDRLFGQGDADRFLFDSGSAFSTADFGIDTLMDFSSGELDKVVLDKTSFIALKSLAGNGFSTATEFAGLGSAAEAATSGALIVYDRSSGGLYYNTNGTTSGFGSGGQFATVLGKPTTFGAGDFLIQA